MRPLAPLLVTLCGCTFLTPLDDLSGPVGPTDAATADTRSDTTVDDASPADTSVAPEPVDAADAPIAPLSSPVVFASNQSEPTGLALDQTTVYWANHGTVAGVARLRKGGAGDLPTHVATAAHPFDVAVTATHVYYSDDTANTVYRYRIGTTVSELAFYGGGVTSYLAIEADRVWTTDWRANGNVTFWTIDGTPGSSIAQYLGVDTPFGIDALGARIYWIAKNTPLIRSGDAQNTTPTVEDTATAEPSGFALDAGHFYWVGTSNTIWRKARGGGADAVLWRSTTSFGPNPDIAVDDTTIYWTEPANGRVMSLAKP